MEELPELTSGSAELGPFLCGDGTGSSSSAMPDRLLVCDGRQLFHVVDVARRREEEVAVDRFASRALRSSLGAHPTSVTASWPTRRGRRCQAGGGVLATRPAVRKGAHAREAADAFQWLELPRFLLEEAKPAAQEAAAADARQQAAPKNKKTPTCSPELGPAGKQAGKKPSPTCSPELAPKQPHGKKALCMSNHYHRYCYYTYISTVVVICVIIIGIVVISVIIIIIIIIIIIAIIVITTIIIIIIIMISIIITTYYYYYYYFHHHYYYYYY